ncbi:glutathione S-transferase [Amphritea opalescens]|uniref:Glutathione S-transferase n=1 Tax=Amphritea opalescens TaxID=2490544 RepID=A0A430KM33_9GAMM|nr:glutathione S-transferase N-terminal domain-containing protein [Amphritea opalescens]RTE64539.1 glutathione S-transferase [Amphritea opalescens]
MKLYDCTSAPNTRRVRMFMAEKGIDIPRIEIDIAQGENLQSDFLSKNPRGVLPLLELDDGSYLDESIAICRYLEELHPEPALMGHDAKTKAKIESCQRHIEFDALLPLADVLRNSAPTFKERALPGTSGVIAIDALVDRGIASYQRFLERLNDRLKDQPYVAGESFSIADITALCALDFAKWAKLKTPEQHTHILRWYALVNTRTSAGA